MRKLADAQAPSSEVVRTTAMTRMESSMAAIVVPPRLAGGRRETPTMPHGCTGCQRLDVVIQLHFRPRTVNDDELAAEVEDALRLRYALGCELGTFFVWQTQLRPWRDPRTQAIPHLGKRMPMFVPSDRLLEKVAPTLRESDYIAYLEASVQGLVDLTFGRPMVGEPDDAKPAIAFPTAIERSVQVGKLFAEVAAALSLIGRIELAGLGTLRRVRTGRTPTDVVTFEATPALTKAVNAPGARVR
jgi:nucleoid DNA-binding protein